jgi:hypothetical protein
MLKQKITKQVKQELKSIIDNYSYWSKQLQEYMINFEYHVQLKLHNIGHYYYKTKEGL